MNNVFVTGAGGFLGQAFLKEGCKPLVCDVLDYNAVERQIALSKPQYVIHLAGTSDPDECERNLEKSIKVNVTGTYNVLENCTKRQIPAILLSSSQIWRGSWWETIWNSHSENSKYTIPVNHYGSQKIGAESLSAMFSDTWIGCKVVRTSFVFNRDRLTPQLHDLKMGMPIDAPTFLKRSFIHTADFVSLMGEYIRQFYQMPHILHLAGSETVSYYDFWLEVARQFSYDTKLVKARRVEKDYIAGQKKAKRPHNGGLDIRLSQKLGFKSYSYIDGIKRMKDES